MESLVKPPILWIRSNGVTLLLASVLLLITSSGVAAQTAAQPDYVSCDGFPAPTSVGDGLDTGQGISSSKAVLKSLAPAFLANTTPFLRHRRTISDHIATEKNLSDCDAALADIQRFPAYWLRRVDLQLARAVHNIGLGRVSDAEKDLDLAASAAVDPSDPYYQRSLGLSLDLLRAYTLRMRGDQAGAEALAMKARESRPYSSQVARAALTAIGPDADIEVRQKLLLGAGKFNSVYSNFAFWDAFEHGRFQDAIMIYPGLAAPMEIPDWTADQRTQAQRLEQGRVRKALFDLQTGLAMAYALAALRRDNDAQQMMTTVRDRMVASEDRSQPLSNRASKREQIASSVAEERNLEIAPPMLGAWSALVDARLAVNAGRKDEALKLLNGSGDPLPTTYALVDVLGSAGDNSPETRAVIMRVLESIKEQNATTSWKDARTFFQILPEAENVNRLPSFANMGGVRAATDGFRVEARPNGDWLVRYEWIAGTESMVEELTLLWAAQAALKNGKNGLIVRQRGMIRWTDVNTFYGSPVSSQAGGYDCRLEVSFVDAEPARDSGDKGDWRFIDARKVVEQLGPIYPRTILR